MIYEQPSLTEVTELFCRLVSIDVPEPPLTADAATAAMMMSETNDALALGAVRAGLTFCRDYFAALKAQLPVQ
jgi:hypothetical protein